MKKKIHGFTLIELVIIVSIIGIMAAVAIPRLQDLIGYNAKSAEQRDLIIDLMVARSEAIKRGTNVVICSNDGGDAAACGGDWDRGWVVFLDPDDDGTFQDSDILRSHGPLSVNRIVSTIPGDAYTFEAEGYGITSGSLMFCDHAGSVAAKGIVISAIGRARISDKDADGSDWANCPP